LKLEALNVSITPGSAPFRLLKVFLNSKLKQASLIFDSDFHPDDLNPPRLVSFFRKFKRSRLQVITNSNGIQMLLNTDHFQSFYESHQFTAKIQKNGYQNISNKAIINSTNSVQKISYQCNDSPQQGIFILPDLPPLPNFKELQFTWISDPKSEKFVDISFIEQFAKLESLYIQLDYREPDTLGFLVDLQNLRELYFSSKQFQKRPDSTKNLPNLTKLEKFSLCLDEPKTLFSLENIRDFISKNKDLGSLDLALTIQNIGIILYDEDQTCLLPSIKNLRLNFPYCKESYIDAANKIVKTLKRVGSLQQLSIEFHQSSSQLNTLLFKEGLVSMESLESLTLKYHNLAKLESNNFGHLKEVFANLGSLKALDLDFSCNNSLEPEEFSSILDGLSQLKNLERFRFKAKVTQLTPAAYNQLLNFLASIKYARSVDFNLKGVSQANGNRIRKDLLPKFSLSKSSFSFVGFI